MEEIELLPCPFCGYAAYVSPLDDMDDRRYWFCCVTCDFCEVKLTAGISWYEYRTLGDKAEAHVQELAARQWNKRAATGMNADTQNLISAAQSALDWTKKYGWAAPWADDLHAAIKKLEDSYRD